METVFPWLVILAVSATLGVLIIGVVAMLRQGKFNERHSNTLMRLRVLFQFIAVMLIAFAYMFGRH